ncbi:CAAX amino protease [Robertmurraya siralis]|uniref:CAAX amino protease n=1 Tax=Robertmurraya siralis TaxID=77777 RepID=A0A919WF95_9BACI|nr:type II CAAX endopeptidase family protein [Robertmurraya siralis]PAE22321.1 CPBP family intramembrane metalloprotease [Bacillus sp. 7504-2]GIN60702.1 CAAX amino protease [Robertmurraya siralis]
MKNKYTEIVQELSDREITFHLIATQVLLLVIALVIGFFWFDDFSSFWELFIWDDKKIWYVGVGAGLAIVALDLLLMKMLPPSYYDDGGLNKRMFENRTVWQIAGIAAMVAVSEEILFRGVLQTHIGLVVTSVLFALIHYRYLFNKFLFVNILLLSFLIGYIYMVTENLLVTIVLHFIVDFLLGLAVRYDKQPPHEQEGKIHE